MRRRAFIRAGAGLASAGGVLGSVAAQSGSGHEVGMYTEGGEYYFDPVGLFVEPGDTVTFVNESGAHTSTAYHPDNPRASVRRIPESAEPWDSGVISEIGGTFEYTFEVPGTYEYYCVPHKTIGMVGRIVCGEPGGIGEEQPIPDPVKTGTVPDSEVIVEQGSVSYPYTPESGGASDAALLRTLGIFGAVGVAGVTTYHLLNSSGERTRVGSAAWREAHDLPDRDGPDGGEQ